MSDDALAPGVVLSEGPRTNTSLSDMVGFNPAVVAALMLLPDEAIVELQKIRHIFWNRIITGQKFEAAGVNLVDTSYYRRKLAALDMAIARLSEET